MTGVHLVIPKFEADDNMIGGDCDYCTSSFTNMVSTPVSFKY